MDQKPIIKQQDFKSLLQKFEWGHHKHKCMDTYNH